MNNLSDKNNQLNSKHLLLKNSIGHSESISKVTLSNNGNILISESYDRTIKLWDIITGHCIDTLENTVTSVALSIDSKILVSGYIDGTIKIIDIESAISTSFYGKHMSLIDAITISNDNNTLISKSSDGIIKIWDTKSSNCIKTLYTKEESVYSIATSNNNIIFYSGNKDGTIEIWNKNNNTSTIFHDKHNTIVTSITISKNHKIIASMDFEGVVKIWDIESYTCIKTFSLKKEDAYSIMFGNDSKTLIFAEKSSSEIITWDLENNIVLNAFSPYEKRDYDTEDCFIQLNNSNETIKNMQVVQLLEYLEDYMGYEYSQLRVTIILLSLDGKILISVSEDGCIGVWDITMRECLITIIDQMQENSIAGYDNNTNEAFYAGSEYVNTTAISLSDDNKTLAIGKKDGTIKIWDIESGICKNTFESNHTQLNKSVYITKTIINKNNNIITLYNNNEIRIWDIVSGKCLQYLKLNYSLRYNEDIIHINPDGKTILISENPSSLERENNIIGNIIKIVNMENDNCIETFRHSADSKFTSFRYLANSQWDINNNYYSPLRYQTLFVVHQNWNLEVIDNIGQTLFILNFADSHNDDIIKLVMSHNIEIIASISKDGIINVWDIKNRKCINTIKANKNITLAEISRDGKIIVTSCNNIFTVLDTITGKCLDKIYYESKNITSLAISTDKKNIIVTDINNLKIINIKKHELDITIDYNRFITIYNDDSFDMGDYSSDIYIEYDETFQESNYTINEYMKKMNTKVIQNNILIQENYLKIRKLEENEIKKYRINEVHYLLPDLNYLGNRINENISIEIDQEEVEF